VFFVVCLSKMQRLLFLRSCYELKFLLPVENFEINQDRDILYLDVSSSFFCDLNDDFMLWDHVQGAILEQVGTAGVRFLTVTALQTTPFNASPLPHAIHPRGAKALHYEPTKAKPLRQFFSFWSL